MVDYDRGCGRRAASGGFSSALLGCVALDGQLGARRLRLGLAVPDAGPAQGGVALSGLTQLGLLLSEPSEPRRAGLVSIAVAAAGFAWRPVESCCVDGPLPCRQLCLEPGVLGGGQAGFCSGRHAQRNSGG